MFAYNVIIVFPKAVLIFFIKINKCPYLVSNSSFQKLHGPQGTSLAR